ncbi:MAG: maltose acetyltransferase domain-containing protein [Deinococcota bacterium]
MQPRSDEAQGRGEVALVNAASHLCARLDAWEADLIWSVESWQQPVPHLSREVYDAWLELQDSRQQVQALCQRYQQPPPQQP